MIYGIGVDLVNIKRMEDVLKRWEDRFINRVFTAVEKEACFKRAFPASAFSLRFAAKEAFSKALGLGMKKGIRWRDIEVLHLKSGKPILRLHGRSLEMCRENNIRGIHLSLSDENEYGIAMVVLENHNETG